MATRYVTMEEGRALSFGEEPLQQAFHHDSSPAKTLPEYTLIKQYVALPQEEKQMAVEVLKFLYQFTFATKEHLQRMLTLKGVPAEGLDVLLEKLLENRQVNYFYLTLDPDDGPMPEDAFVVYCMDFGGLAILTHFTDSDCAVWFTTDSCRKASLVAKYLNTVVFYLVLAEAQGEGLRYFKPIFDVTCMHTNVRFSAAFEIVRGGANRPFIVESIRKCDLPIEWMTKIDARIVTFACRNDHWGKYFPGNEPTYLFLVEDEEQALEAARLFYARTEKDNFRLLTDGQLKRPEGLKGAYFLKYEPNQDSAQPGTIKRVKSSLLSGEA